METLHNGRTIWVGYQNGLVVTSMAGRTSDGEYSDFLAVVAGELKKRRRFATLCDIREAESTATTRLMWANFVKDNEGAMGGMCHGIALIVSSGLMAGAVTALSWLVRPPYRQKSTSSLTEGYDWCAGLLPSDHRRAIPSQQVVLARLNATRDAHAAGRSV